MAFHGKIIDSGFDPQRDRVYSLFVEYFENPDLFKIKDVGNYSMYAAKVYALLGIEFRYLLLFVEKDSLPMKSKEKMQNLKWISLQTRTLTDDHDIPWYSYTPKRLSELDKKISVSEKTEQSWTYNVEQFPLQIVLLLKSKGLGYNPNGTIIPALETFQTIVNFA